MKDCAQCSWLASSLGQYPETIGIWVWKSGLSHTSEAATGKR